MWPAVIFFPLGGFTYNLLVYVLLRALFSDLCMQFPNFQLQKRRIFWIYFGRI